MKSANPIAVAFEHVFDQIVVPIDFSDVTTVTLEYAEAIARAFNSELMLVHVDVPADLISSPDGAWVDDAELQAVGREQLEQLGRSMRRRGFRARTVCLTGQVQEQLLAAAVDNKADLIVLGTHGRRGLGRLFAGSETEALIRRVQCPVLSVGPLSPELGKKPWSIRNVVCATTLEPRSAEMVAFAYKLAAVHEAELALFHVKKSPEEEMDWSNFEEAFHRYIPEDLGKRSWLRMRLSSRAPGNNIVTFAKENQADLIVMGAHAATQIDTHLARGTVARVLAEAECPVMTLQCD